MSDSYEIWQPPVQEPDPIEAAARDVIRHRLPALFGQELTSPVQFAHDRVILPSGEIAEVRMSGQPIAPKKWRGRAALHYGIEGGIGVNGTLFVMAADAIVDLRTHAFLSITFRFERQAM